MAIGFLHNRKGVRLTGDADVSDVLASKTFYKDSYREKKTGTLALTGDAIAANVLAGKKFYKDDAKTQITGTMPDNGTVSTDISAKATEVTIAEGKHSGSGKVKISAAEQAKIITGNIKSGVTILGVVGNSNVVDTSSGDAVAGQILAPATAYVNGVKITGTLNKYNVTAGEFYVGVSAGLGESNSSTPVKVKEIRVLKSGTYRVFFTLTGIPTTYVTGQIYKNGVAYGTSRANHAQFYDQDYVEDLSFSANDYVQLYISSPSGYMGSGGNLKVGINPGFSTSDITTIIT